MRINYNYVIRLFVKSLITFPLKVILQENLFMKLENILKKILRKKTHLLKLPMTIMFQYFVQHLQILVQDLDL